MGRSWLGKGSWFYRFLPPVLFFGCSWESESGKELELELAKNADWQTWQKGQIIGECCENRVVEWFVALFLRK